jgi:hypothetical protein
MKHTPYDTGKVKIGLLYTPPTPVATPEETWVQSVLLCDKQGWSEDTHACVLSVVAIAIIALVMLLLGGTPNA